jgi:hypothetical protein
MTDQAIRAQTLIRLCTFVYGPFIGPAVALYFFTLYPEPSMDVREKYTSPFPPWARALLPQQRADDAA